MSSLAQLFGYPDLSETACGCELAGSQEENATIATQRILKRYTELSARGEKLRQILTTGATVPCEIWQAYNQACLDYIAKSQEVFTQLSQQGIAVDQVVYSNGRPVPDPNAPGQFRTVRISTPLRPPAFTFVQAQCPSVARFQGAAWGGGWMPVPIEPSGFELGAVPEATLRSAGQGALLLLTGGGGALVGVVGEVLQLFSQASVWIADYQTDLDKIIDAYTTCFERQRAAGVEASSAGQRCTDATPPTKSPVVAQALQLLRNPTNTFWTWAIVAGGVLVSGGILVMLLRRQALEPDELEED